MDFDLTQRQAFYRDRVRDFIETHVRPRVGDYHRQLATGDRWQPIAIIEELKPKAREAGLWNLFMPPGPAVPQVDDSFAFEGEQLTNLEYALCAEEMGRIHWASEVFNCSAPDTGNMEVLHRYGTREQKDSWLAPLMMGQIRSAFLMTEPGVASSDATNIECSIRLEGNEYVVNGRKWWSSGAGDPRCKVAILMGKTDPGAAKHEQQSMILVPMDADGITVERHLTVYGYDDAPHGHMEIRLDNVRVPPSNLLLGEGRGFEIAQGRLGPGRIHHCMRTVGAAEEALKLMCERLQSRTAFGKRISEHGIWEQRVADARIEIEATRLLCLKAADMMDRAGNKAAKAEIAMIKVKAPQMALKVIDDAVQAFGAAGVSQDTPLAASWVGIRTLRLADGPDEVHNRAIARMEFAKHAPQILPGTGRGTTPHLIRGGGGGPPNLQGSTVGPHHHDASRRGPPPRSGEDFVEVSSSPCSMPEVEPIEGPVPRELVDTALKPLWGCWRALLAAREKREPLELDLPERQVMLDEKGRITSVAPRERLDAHRLVEDYMIAANVAAARALEAKKAPVMYRIHEPPSREKLVALKDYLDTFDIQFALGQVVKPGTFNRIIERVGDSDARPEIMEQLLRTQMQARYSPERLGHFGLALATYAHFTSPIRRYADLLVHRALVRAYKLGDGGLPAGEEERYEQIGEAISMLERRAMEAERETMDRYVAAYLADRVGQLIDTRITGVQPFGFFATVDGLGGDGLVFAANLGDEYFRYDEAARQLVGDETGDTYRQGQKLTLRLVEANPVSGSLSFELPEGSYGRGTMRRSDRVRPGNRRGRPANIRHQGKRR